MNTCTTPDCSNPTDRYLCNQCTKDLQAWLDKVPEMMDELFITMARLDATAPRNSEGGDGMTTNTAMPVRVGALEVRTALRLWVHIHPDGTMAPLNADQLAKDQYAGGFLPMLQGLFDRAERAIDNPMEKHVYGECGAELDDGTYCPEQVTAAPDAHQTECLACGAVHDLDAIRKWRTLSVQGHPVSPDECRNAFQEQTGLTVTKAVFKSWVRRGKLRYVHDRVRNDGEAQRKYLVLDLLKTYLQTNGRNP